MVLRLLPTPLGSFSCSYSSFLGLHIFRAAPPSQPLHPDLGQSYGKYLLLRTRFLPVPAPPSDPDFLNSRKIPQISVAFSSSFSVFGPDLLRPCRHLQETQFSRGRGGYRFGHQG